MHTCSCDTLLCCSTSHARALNNGQHCSQAGTWQFLIQALHQSCALKPKRHPCVSEQATRCPRHSCKQASLAHSQPEAKLVVLLGVVDLRTQQEVDACVDAFLDQGRDFAVAVYPAP